MNLATQNHIEEKLLELIRSLFPTAIFVPKYGGNMIEIVPGDHSTQIGGYFFYQEHMSIEFRDGANFDDPENCLEGKGKLRRHIKIRNPEDIDLLPCREMFEQAVKLLDIK